MKFSLYIKGRAFSFQIVKVLIRNDIFNYLVSSYPKFYIKKYGINKRFVKSFFFIEILQRVLIKINKILRLNFYIKIINFTDFVSDLIHSKFFINNSDVYLIGFGNSALFTLKKLKKKKIKSIYFLNNSSDAFFDQTLHDEYKKFNLPIPKINSSLRERINLSIKNSDFIAAISTFQANTFIKDGLIDKNKIFVTSMGVDENIFKPNKKKNKKFIVTTVANDFIRKGIIYLIQAFNELNLSNSELWLIGNLDKNLSKKLVTLNNNIVFKGSINEFHLPKYYNESSIFCLPTLEDGGPMVIPQAMSCALPVISTYYCVAPDLIKNGVEGFLIERRNKDAIKEKIQFFYDNENQRLEMGNNARNRILNEATWDIITDKIIFFSKNKLNKL